MLQNRLTVKGEVYKRNRKLLNLLIALNEEGLDIDFPTLSQIINGYRATPPEKFDFLCSKIFDHWDSTDKMEGVTK